MSDRRMPGSASRADKSAAPIRTSMNSRPTLIVFYGLSGPTLTFIKIAGCERSFQVTVATASASILHRANDNYPGGREADGSCRSWGSVFRQQLEPLPFG